MLAPANIVLYKFAFLITVPDRFASLKSAREHSGPKMELLKLAPLARIVVVHHFKRFRAAGIVRRDQRVRGYTRDSGGVKTSTTQIYNGRYAPRPNEMA